MPEYIYCMSCKGFVPLEVLHHIVECAYCGERQMINLVHPEATLV